MEKEKQNLKKKQGKTINKWAYKTFRTYKILNKIILKTLKAKIPKKKISLLSNIPLAFFRRILKR
jgi:hypothetical protein